MTEPQRTFSIFLRTAGSLLSCDTSKRASASSAPDHRSACLQPGWRGYDRIGIDRASRRIRACTTAAVCTWGRPWRNTCKGWIRADCAPAGSVVVRATGCDDGVGVGDGDGVSSNPAASSAVWGRFREAGSTEAGEAAWVVSIGVGGASGDGETVDGASAARAAAACGLSGGGAFGFPKKLSSEGWLGFLALPLGVLALGAMVSRLIAPPPVRARCPQNLAQFATT